ncbi:MAG: nitrous oxide reductase accessory protein NosL [Syntrophobacteraceae bacterium]
MKRLTVGLIFCFVFASVAVFAQTHSHQGSDACGYCGMDRQKFAHSAMLIEYEDGSAVGTCSIHCAAVDLALSIDKTPKKMTVGDLNTKKQIDAEAACWTLGGDQPGVMTKRAKWAFENKADCEKFAKEHGAAIISFDDAMKASYEDMYADTKMIRDKRKMKRQQQQQQQPEVKK